ncbi:hypothetical protein [Novosphingobium beihaiensis]|uniref:Uncharacterized protein n=1 Tax=Novosphingobium beihaiensis TaxID=2930389 RepID=A0ABT0BT94_9SPHN|nr:hypothetical protein [Novosphingobium beihaiensis]MCJ2187889.1 hypothetical protein [Novosphingobium beihaiensis]
MNTVDALSLGITGAWAQIAQVNAARQVASGIVERSSVALAASVEGRMAQQSKDADKKAEQRRSDQMLLVLLDDASRLSRELGAKIDRMEAVFEAKHGDAWREIMANKVLDPDEIPQQREGETITEYRERLEKELIEKMIDPKTGKIKPEYANSDDPEVRALADWALAQNAKRGIDKPMSVLTDENSTEAEKKAAQADLGSSLEKAIVANKELNKHGHGSAELEKRADSLADGQTSGPASDSEITTFFKP